MTTLFLAIQRILSPTIWRVAAFSISKEKQTAVDTLWKGRFCRRMAGSSTHNERLAPETKNLHVLHSMWMRRDSWESGWKLPWLVLSWSRQWQQYIRVSSSPYLSFASLHTLFSTIKTPSSMPHGHRLWDQNKERILSWSAVAGFSNPNSVDEMNSWKLCESASWNWITNTQTVLQSKSLKLMLMGIPGRFEAIKNICDKGRC